MPASIQSIQRAVFMIRRIKHSKTLNAKLLIAALLTLSAFAPDVVAEADDRCCFVTDSVAQAEKYDGGLDKPNIVGPQIPLSGQYSNDVSLKQYSGKQALILSKKADGSWNIRKENIKVSVILTSEDPRSDFDQVRLSPADGKFYFLDHYQEVRAGAIETVPNTRYEWKISDSDKFKNYQIKAEGQWLTISNGQKTAIILHPYDDHHIQFAGDLNQDGWLDFIISLSHEKGSSENVLFLSDRKNGILLRQAGKELLQGC